MLCCFIGLVVWCFILQAQVLTKLIDPESSPARETPEVIPTPVTNKRADRTLNQAYSDTFKLLSESNECSNFYGGPAVAVTVLNEFYGRLRKAKLPESIAFSMHGKALYVLNVEVKAKFRVFEQTVVNQAGSFYIRNGPMGIHIPNVGSFLPATRSARALTLLHELGHMIRSPSGEWLLQDDGNDSERSRRNTAVVQSACNDQLKALQ
jgi:hypothetical protein